MNRKLNFELTVEIERSIKKIEAVCEFAKYFRLNPPDFPDQRRQALNNRLLHYMPSNMEASQEQMILSLLSKSRPPSTDDEQKLINIFNVFRFADQDTHESYSTDFLRKIHGMLLQNLPDTQDARQFRISGAMFDEPPVTDSLYPENLREFLDAFVSLSHNAEVHPLVRAWIIYFHLIAIKPFEQENDLVARAFCYYFLYKEGYGFHGLLRLEKNVFHSKKYMAFYINFMENRNYEELLSMDLTPFLTLCMQGLLQNVLSVEQIYLEEVRKHLQFNNLTPRHRNLINFWLEKAYPYHMNKLGDLNERQKDIIMQICKNGMISTGDLVPIYNVDRKTIQRDFNALVDNKIVEVRGAGRGLRYTLNFNIEELIPQAMAEQGAA